MMQSGVMSTLLYKDEDGDDDEDDDGDLAGNDRIDAYLKSKLLQSKQAYMDWANRYLEAAETVYDTEHTIEIYRLILNDYEVKGMAASQEACNWKQILDSQDQNLYEEKEDLHTYRNSAIISRRKFLTCSYFYNWYLEEKRNNYPSRGVSYWEYQLDESNEIELPKMNRSFDDVFEEILMEMKSKLTTVTDFLMDNVVKADDGGALAVVSEDLLQEDEKAEDGRSEVLVPNGLEEKSVSNGMVSHVLSTTNAKAIFGTWIASTFFKWYLDLNKSNVMITMCLHKPYDRGKNGHVRKHIFLDCI